MNRTAGLPAMRCHYLADAPKGTAQTVMEAHASIPFEVWIEGSHLHAGNYQIEQIESIPYLLVLEPNGCIAAGAYTVAIDKDPVKRQRRQTHLQDTRRQAFIFTEAESLW